MLAGQWRADDLGGPKRHSEQVDAAIATPSPHVPRATTQTLDCRVQRYGHCHLGQLPTPYALLPLTSGHVTDGVVTTVVTKLELEGLPAKRLTQHLVAHANAKDGLLAQDDLGVFHSVRSGRRIALR